MFHTAIQLVFVYNQLIFPQLLQVRSVPKNKLLGVVAAELLQAGCPSCHPTNSIKALKDVSYVLPLSVDYGQFRLTSTAKLLLRLTAEFAPFQ